MNNPWIPQTYLSWRAKNLAAKFLLSWCCFRVPNVTTFVSHCKRVILVIHRMHGMRWGFLIQNLLSLHRELFLSRILYSGSFVPLTQSLWQEIELIRHAGPANGSRVSSFSTVEETWMVAQHMAVQLDAKKKAMAHFLRILEPCGCFSLCEAIAIRPNFQVGQHIVSLVTALRYMWHVLFPIMNCPYRLQIDVFDGILGLRGKASHHQCQRNIHKRRPIMSPLGASQPFSLKDPTINFTELLHQCSIFRL